MPNSYIVMFLHKNRHYSRYRSLPKTILPLFAIAAIYMYIGTLPTILVGFCLIDIRVQFIIQFLTLSYLKACSIVAVEVLH